MRADSPNYNPHTQVMYVDNVVRDAGVEILYRSVQVGLPNAPLVEQRGSAAVMQVELFCKQVSRPWQ